LDPRAERHALRGDSSNLGLEWPRVRRQAWDRGPYLL